MFTLCNEKEVIVLASTDITIESLPINEKAVLFKGNISMGEIIVMSKNSNDDLRMKHDNPEVRPALRAFGKTQDDKFVIGQQIFVTLRQDKETICEWITMLVVDVIPVGYLK